jgi:tetratricopeptide (TPR) repeat protein
VVAPAPAAIHALPGPAAELVGVRHEFQGWNNCGPATLAMNLSYFGRAETQNETAPFLKPNKDDKNVSPGDMAAYAQSIGYGAQVVVGADLEFLRTLVANNFPVIVESWYIPDPNDEMGHYYLLTGYNGDTLTLQDSYKGPNIQKPAADFDALWKVFNRTAVVIWPPEKADLATSILGERADPQRMVQNALATAQAEVSANPQDKFAWFNLGSSLVASGDAAGAVQAFDTARSLGLPWRMLWYQFGPYEAYFANGQYEEVVGLTTATLQGADNLEESYYWRGRAQAELGQTEAARADFQKAVSLNSSFAPAHHALAELP